MLFAKKESSQSTELLDEEFNDAVYNGEEENFDEFTKLLDSLNDGPSTPLEANTVLKIPPNLNSFKLGKFIGHDPLKVLETV
jgi:hypothetical protein